MIIVECYNDQALMYRMNFTPDQVAHEFGRSRVLGRVERERKAVIGIIDEDPQAGKPPEMRKYEVQRGSTEAIRLLKRKNDDTKQLIQISPRLENWLCGVAKRNKISPERFGLPNDPEGLHSISLRKDKENFRRFLITLIRAKDNEINMFKEWIRATIE